MRETLRTGFILLALFIAVFIPFTSSGYSELNAANAASSHTEAAAHYQAAAQRIPWRPDLYELAGHNYYHAREYTPAEAMYKKAFQRNALSPDGWVAWGDVVYLNDKPEQAVRIWEQALEQPAPSKKLYSRLAQTLQQKGEYSKAAHYLQRYLEVYSDDAAAHYRLGLLLTLSNPNEALPELLNASQLDPEFDPAVQTLRNALNLSSLSDIPSEQLVVIGRGLGLVDEWQLAHAAFEEAVKVDEKNAEAWAWLGEAEQQSAGGEALVHLDRALALDPNSIIIHGLRGLYFQRAGNHREALAEFQSAAKLEPENPVWYVSIGEEFSKLGDLIRAIESYQYATTLAPDDPQYWRMLAAFSAQNNINVKDVGIPAAQKAVILSPDDPLALDALGWLLILDGRHYEAEQILKRALKHDPKLAQAHFHLALLFMEMNDRSSMYDHLVQARMLGSKEAVTLLEFYFP